MVCLDHFCFVFDVYISIGEGQFGVVHQAVADGICSFDSGRQIVAVKTLKRMHYPDIHTILTYNCV